MRTHRQRINRPAVRVSKHAAGNRYIADVAQATDYDAYGSWRFGRSTMMTESYRYMWHGMRRPDGLSDPHMYITPFRLYDVRLGRWNTRDPIFDPSVSPYEGMGSNPISLTDLWGLNPGGGQGSGESTDIMPAKKQPSGNNATASSIAGEIPTSGRAQDIEGVASYYSRGATVEAVGVATLELTEKQRQREWAEGERYYAGPMGEFNYHKGAFWPHDDYVVAVNHLRKALTWTVPESMSNEDILTYSKIDPDWLGFDLENTSADFQQILAELTPNPALQPDDEVLPALTTGGVLGPQVALRIGKVAAKTIVPIVKRMQRHIANRRIASQWHNSNFESVVDAIKYHVKQHGGGRTIEQYTKDATDFYKANKALGVDHPLKDGSVGIKISTKKTVNGKNVKVGGIFTKEGKIVSYWDETK